MSYEHIFWVISNLILILSINFGIHSYSPHLSFLVHSDSYPNILHLSFSCSPIHWDLLTCNAAFHLSNCGRCSFSSFCRPLAGKKGLQKYGLFSERNKKTTTPYLRRIFSCHDIVRLPGVKGETGDKRPHLTYGESSLVLKPRCPDDPGTVPRR